jgi:membrane-bound lytic murein transglycosylase MltF
MRPFSGGTIASRILYCFWITSALVLIAQPLLAFDRYNRVVKYDKYFSKYSKRYFGPNFDWRHFKAQAIAESHLKATATSRVGAVGVMQIMPRTFEEIVHKNPSIKGTREQPKWNISAGIFYDRKLWKLWKAERSFKDRLAFMFGSYNAGSRNILRAQKIAEASGMNPNLWGSIEPALPEITGDRSRETIGYIKKIQLIKGVLH